MKFNIAVSSNSTIEELAQICFCQMNIPENIRDYEFTLLFNAEKLNIHDKSTLKEKNIYNCITINIYKNNNLDPNRREGITLKAFVKIINKNNHGFNQVAGTLQLISQFYRILALNIGPIEKLIIKGKEIKNDNRTFSSIGIREDFTCYIQLKQNK